MATKADKLVRKGQAQLRRGKARKAWELFREACEDAKYDPDVWLARAEAAAEIGERGDAAEAMFRVVDMYARGGMPSKAVELADRVLALEPAHAGARRMKKILGTTDEAPAEEEAAEPVSATATATATGTGTGSGTGSGSGRPGTDDGYAEIVIARDDHESGAIAVPIAGPSSVVAAEYRVGRLTGEMALANIALSERLAATSLSDDVREIGLDDDDDLDLVQAVAATIDTSPLLSELDSDLVRTLIDAGSLVSRTAGQAVFLQDEPGSSLYLVLKGEVSVERGQPPKVLARLRAGAFFGEMALLTNAPRSATVRAARDTHLLEVSRRVMRELIDRDARVLKLLMRFFRARLVGNLMATSPLFARFSRDDRRTLVRQFRLRELRAGHLIIRENKPAEGLYLVLVGQLQVFTGGAITDPRVLGELGPGDVFGEMSLLGERPAMASIRTQGRSWVLLLAREDFAALADAHPEVADQLRAIAEERRERNARVSPV